jgi:hypothetical protein
MANEIVVSEQAQQFLPVMSMATALQRYSMTVEFTKQIMRAGIDFGVVPGTGNKPTLLKPGAEKLCSFFGLSPAFVPIDTVEDWTGADHGNEAFFLYRYRCELYRNGTMIGSGVGSCNSWESKYRYRNAQRVCPSCGQSTIIKGKSDWGGGWVCLKSKGGCGQKYKEGDAAIERQDVGKVKNPDVADVVNTVDKMAQKRALVAATLIAVNASEFYTQDVEDLATNYVDAEFTVTQEPPKQNGNGKANGHAPVATPVAAPIEVPQEVSLWAKPVDALEWAVGIGAIDHPEHAKNLMDKIKREKFGGKWQGNEMAIYVTFYHECMVRVKAAVEAVTLETATEQDPEGVFA